MNNKCAFNQEKISAYMDNELTGADRSEVEMHLTECQECKDLINAFQQNDVLFAEHAQNPLSASYWDSYDQKLKRRISAQTKTRLYTKYILPAAAALLIALTAFYFIYTKATKPVIVVVVVDSGARQYQDILNKSESVLIGIANLDENNPQEIAIIKQALLESNLPEKIRELKIKSENKNIQESLKKLDALFTLLQNENSPIETKMVKELIIEKSLIEEIRAKQHLSNEVKL